MYALIEGRSMMDFWNGHPEVRTAGKTLPDGEALTTLPYTGKMPTVEEAVRALYTDGYVVFPGVLDADGVALMRARIDAMGSQDDADYFVPKWCYNKQIGSAFHQNPDLLDYIDPPVVIDVAEAVLDSK